MYRRAALFLLGSVLTACSGGPESTATTNGAANTPAEATGLRLNEIRILPAEDMPTFIELTNSGEGPVALDGTQLLIDGGSTIAMPLGLALEPGTTLTISFDDGRSVDADGAHFPATDFAGGAAGRIELRLPSGTADAVSWGRPQLASVSLCRGGRCGEPAAGDVIARVPNANEPFDAAAWAPLDAELATPGAANPWPPVAAFAALPGMIFTGVPHFSWYSVPGAVRYHLEIARDALFANLVHQADVAATPGMRLEQVTARGPELPPGDYLWRVRALGANGESAEPSETVPFTVDPSRAVTVPVGTTEQREGAGQGAQPSPTDATILTVLDVPIIKHAKDTSMLTLEAASEERWDRPNITGYPYCARAGVAMVNAYYGGNLSQDRIGYEVFKNLRGGPEYDLPIVGIEDPDTDRYSLPLAIGTSGNYVRNIDYAYGKDRGACFNYVIESSLAMCANSCAIKDTKECSDCRIAAEKDIDCPGEIAYRWGMTAIEDIQREIDARRPIIATTSNHLFLIVGYRVEAGRFSFFYQDEGGRTEVRATRAGLTERLFAYWKGLAAERVGSDEPEIGRDSDGDGVVDFDETERFGSDVQNRDSDGDSIPDKQEIGASVWDAQHGYHRAVAALDPNAATSIVALLAANTDLSGRDFDRDGASMELDPDNDGGGCRDGVEDVNFDGIRSGRETYNFDPADDDCDVVLGGRVTMRYGFVPHLTPPCKGSVTVRLKFGLEPGWGEIPEEQRTAVASIYQARQVAYEISTDGCDDIVGGGFDFRMDTNTVCKAPAGAKSGVVALGPETLGYITFAPLMPQLSVGLPPEILLDISGQCVYYDGRTTELAVTGVGGQTLNIDSGASCRTSDRYVYGEPPDLLSFCVEPTVCDVATNTDPGVLAECFTRPERYAVIPFAGTLRKLGGIVTGHDISDMEFPIEIDGAEVRYEICRGCGDEFLE